MVIKLVFYNFHPYEKTHLWWKKTQEVDIKLFIHIHFKWVEKYYCIHLLFLIDWISQVARQKINAEATYELLQLKPPTIFHIFQFHIRLTQQKSPSSSQFTLDHHSSSITQNQPHSKILEENRRTTHYYTRWLSTIHETLIPIQRKRFQIMKVTVSWKRFNNRIDGDFEEESLFED